MDSRSRYVRAPTKSAVRSRAPAAATASSAAPAPRARTRPGHNTPLLVLYGSNLGTAEELATRVADLAEVNGFATKLAPLDDFVGKLPEQGGVLIFCASYNGARARQRDAIRQMARRRPAERCLRESPLRGVRLRQQRLGRDLSVVPRFIDDAIGGTWRAQRLCAGRGRCAQRSRRPVRKLVRSAGAAGDEGIRRRFQFQPQRRRRAALRDRAGGAVRGQCHCGARRQRADEDAGQYRIAKQDRRPCVGTIDPAYRGATAAWRELSRRRSSQRGAAQRSHAGRFRRAPLRIYCPPTRSGCRSRKAAARNCRSATAFRSGGCSASSSNCSRSRPASRSRSWRKIPAAPIQNRNCWPMSATMPQRPSATARIFSASANRCSICWRNIRPANCRSMPIWKCCRCWRRVIIRSRRRHRAMPRAAASRSPWSRVPRVRAAASTRASARTISPAAAPAKRSTPRCARPRPGFGCPMILRCRSS